MLYSATDWTFGESSTIQLDLSAQLVPPNADDDDEDFEEEEENKK